MSKSNKKRSEETVHPTETVYPTELLRKSKHLSMYQPDFVKVILTGPAYSISEAKCLLDHVLGGK